MSDVGPPPAKRSRIEANLVENGTNKMVSSQNSAATSTRQTRYMLRSKYNSEQMEHIELPEPKRKSRGRIEKLMDLSGDCLLLIFKEMDPKTLSHVADTCDRLRDLAKYHFRVKYSHFDFESFDNAGRYGTDRLEDAEKLFRIFGDQIVSLTINRYVFIQSRTISNDILRFVKRYCYQLKTLKLYNFHMRNISAYIIGPLLNRIEDLAIFNGEMIDCNPGPMINLKQLQIDDTNCDSWSDVLWKNFPKLEDVTIKYSDYLNNDSIIQFINMNPLLKRLSITACYNTTSTFFKAIGKLEHLQEFEYKYGGNYSEYAYQSDLMHLSNLKNLKKLKLDCLRLVSPFRLIEKFIENGITLSHLTLMSGVFKENLYNNIAKMTTLKVLKVIDAGHLDEIHILSLAKNLKQLETLHIVDTQTKLSQHGITTLVREASQLKKLELEIREFILTQPIYFEILGIIQKREEINKLELTICGNREQLTVPDEVAKGNNEKWLIVKREPKRYSFLD